MAGVQGIIINKSTRRAVIHVTANATVSLANLSAAAFENVVSASITQVAWCGNVSVGRGNSSSSNTYLIFQSATSGQIDFQRHGIILNQDAGASIQLTVNDPNSWLQIEVGKQSQVSNTAPMY